jgi:hypothetical protein
MRKHYSVLLGIFIVVAAISPPLIILNIPLTSPIQYFSIKSKCSLGGSINPLGYITVEAGKWQNFSIIPEDSHSIDDVIINGTSFGSIDFYNFTNVYSNQTIEVLFTKKTFNIEITANSNGTTMPSKSDILEYGDNKIMIFSPASGFHISDVLVDNSSMGPLHEFTFYNITSNHTVEAFFEINLYSIEVSYQGNGNIIPGSISEVEYGSSQNFQIVPAEGNHIEDVKINNISIGAVENYTLTNITNNQTIHAIFEVNKYRINATSDINGSISSPGIIETEHGESISYYFYPNTNFAIQNVTVDGIALGSLTNYTFENIDTNHSIHVTFVSTVQKYALVIGISNYKAVTDLNYCDEDANAWYSYFTSKNYLVWVLGDNTNSYAQFNGTATEKTINETIQKIISLADYNDEVALTFSGHGDGDGSGDSYLFAWDAGSGEDGYDGYIDDFELSDYLADLKADKLFIFLDACNSGGMNETMDNPNINHIFMTTTSTENGLGWDVPEFELGAWTHFFLTQGLNDLDRENWNFTSVYLSAYNKYHTYYGDGGTWNGPTRWDHPVYFNSDKNNPFLLENY